MATTTSPSPPPPLARRGCPLTRPYTIRGTQANLPRRNCNRNRPRRYYNHRLPDSVTNTTATSSPLHQPPPRHPYVHHRSNTTFAAPTPPHPTHPTPPDAAHPTHPTPPRHLSFDATPIPPLPLPHPPSPCIAWPPTCGTYYYITTIIIITVITVIIIIIIIFNYECGKSGVTAT